MREVPLLYYADTGSLKDSVLYEKLYAGLPESRKKKVDRIRPVAEKMRSLAAGVLLARGFADRGISPESMDNLLEEGPGGKPGIRDQRFFFNLSHSGGYAIALFASHEAGCDVEEVRPEEKTGANLRIAKRFFTPEESRYLEELAREDKGAVNGEFTRMWSYKESYCKALGEGLKLPFDSFCVLDFGLHNSTTYKTVIGDYCFHSIDLDPAYRITCCIRNVPEAPCLIPGFGL